MELERQPVARAALLGVIGRLRLGLGDHAEALELLRRQSALLADVDGAPASLRLESASDLGHALRVARRPGECVDHMRPLQPLARRQERRMPRQAAGFSTQLGRCHRALGEPDQAEVHFRRALALRRDRLPGTSGIAENIADLAGLDADAGRHAAALQGLEAAHVQLQETVGGRNPLTIRVLRETCALRARSGQLLGASEACAHALATAAGLLGREHRTTLEARDEYAAILSRIVAPADADADTAPGAGTGQAAEPRLSPAEDPAATARSGPGPASPS